MQSRISDVRQLLDEYSAEEKVVRESLLRIKRDITRAKRRKTHLLMSAEIIRKIALKTQDRFKGSLESLATLAIRPTIPNRKYRLRFNFKPEHRGKPVCFMEILEGKHVLDPRDDIGFGLADIISFIMTIAMLGLRRPKVKKFLWLDEPMKNIGVGEIVRRVGLMLREISDKLKFQIVINTHDRALMEFGDKVYQLEHTGEYTEVR